jgi:hypothetical protein
MRTAIIDYLKANRGAISPLIVADHLPWEDNNGSLYHHNRKHVYVGLDQVAQQASVNALNGSGAVDEETVISVYFVIDAKQLLTNYETIVQTIKDARLTADITGVISRTCQVKTEFVSDDLLTSFEFSFRKLITN